MLSEDLTAFFDTDGIGDSATVGSSSIDGVFDADYVTIGSVEGYYPTFLCSDASAALITKNSTVITIKSITYTAISKRPDNTGLTLLILKKT